MRKTLLLLLAGFVVLGSIAYYKYSASPALLSESYNEEESENKAENQRERFDQLFEEMKDPALGYVPNDRLAVAIEQTKALRNSALARTDAMTWIERGPIYDSLGPSNGNGRAGYSYTSGIIQSMLLDTITDPTGNTLFAGTNSGGLWRCTNFLSADPPNWQPVNDFMSNLGVASICRNPLSPNIMYVATGDGNTRDVRGNGIWKSVDNGATWTVLPSSVNYRYSYKILCDAEGNVFVATAGSGLIRSTNGGANWTSIGPSGNTASNSSYVTDIEISTTGRLHASFGLSGINVRHYYTDFPGLVSSSSGWNQSYGIRIASVAATRMELATQGDVVYAVTVNSASNMDSCYKSTDGGANFDKMNNSAYTTGLGSSQGWYAITIGIDPDNPNTIIIGGLDAYKSTNSGTTITRLTYWVNNSPYVHADHHEMDWFKKDGESRIIIGCDGGVFLSRNGGNNWLDRNQNMGIKQFYSCAIHPAAGSNMLLAGSQDNGTHQINTPGKTHSKEVTGGDGCYVHINQKDPQIQFGSYIYNQYRRSVNGGATWSSLNLSSTAGYFINPFDYDDSLNVMFASNANTSSPNNQIRIWQNANTAGSTTSITVAIAELSRGGTANATAFKVSPYTPKMLYVGSSRGTLLKIVNANNVTNSTVSDSVTDIGSSSFPSGTIKCINTGTDDQNIVVTFTSYGVNNVWVTNNGGATWSDVDGNLPDMPVWNATFFPGDNSKIILGTETGVFTTSEINGSNTVWTPNPGFPMVRTSMLRVRKSDNTIVAGTYGRGLWTANLNQFLPITLSAFSGQLDNKTALLKWSTSNELNARNFDIEKSTDEIHYKRIGTVNAAGNSSARKDYSFRDQNLAQHNYYRLRMNDLDGKNKMSQVVLIKYQAPTQSVIVITNPFRDRLDVQLARPGNQAKLQLINMNGSVVAEKIITNASGLISWQFNSNVSAGAYILRSQIDGKTFTNKVIKN